MKRDMDLIREVLLAIEERDDGDSYFSVSDLFDSYQQQYRYCQWCEEAGLIKGANRGLHVADVEPFLPERLTFKGADFLDSVRDPKVWAKTKAGAEAVGGLTFELLGELATGLLRTKIKQHTGIDI